MSEFAAFVHRIYIGAKTADHPAEDDYRQLFDDFIAGKPDVADRVADEIKLLWEYGEYDLVRTMIITLVHDAQQAYESRAKSKCVWVENQDPDYWETSCGQSFTLIEGTLEDNHIRFCAFCGCEIAAQHGLHATDLLDELSEMSDEEYQNHLERKADGA